LQVLQNDKRGKVEGDQCRRPDGEIRPDCFDEIGAFSSRIGVVLGLVAIAHTDIVDEEFRHRVSVWQMGSDFRPPKRTIGKSREEGDSVRQISLTTRENLEWCVLRSDDGADLRIVAKPLTSGEPGPRRRTLRSAVVRAGNRVDKIRHIFSPFNDLRNSAAAFAENGGKRHFAVTPFSTRGIREVA
jgi:hypothetical protein